MQRETSLSSQVVGDNSNNYKFCIHSDFVVVIIVVDILLQESDTRKVQILKYIQYIKININIRVDNHCQ